MKYPFSVKIPLDKHAYDAGRYDQEEQQVTELLRDNVGDDIIAIMVKGVDDDHFDPTTADPAWAVKIGYEPEFHILYQFNEPYGPLLARLAWQ